MHLWGFAVFLLDSVGNGEAAFFKQGKMFDTVMAANLANFMVPHYSFL